MSNDYSREVLRRVVAQVCQIIGWQGINSTPLDILVHILEKYILTICTQTQRYAEQFNRTEPNLHDLGLVFRDINVPLNELREYARCVPPAPCHLNVSQFPIPKESHLNFLKPGSQEVLTRQVHVHEYLPAMYPEKEKDDSPPIADTIEIVQNGIDHVSDSMCKSPEISVTDETDKSKDVFKRPIDPISLTPPTLKRHRLKLEEEDSRTREISSVMMTMSGFLSPAREGKLPEARTPIIIHDTHPEKPKSVPHPHPIPQHMLPSHPTPPPPHKSEHSEKKSKRNRAPNGKIDKVRKKDKAQKNPLLGKQKNSENRINKLAMHLARSKVRPSGPTKYPGEVPPLAQLPSPLDNNLKVPKQEPPEKVSIISEPPPLCINPLSALPTPPVRHRNPETTGEPPPLVHTPAPVPPIRIKEERMDGEKLTSQPDRSKLNIFKKISKVKDHDFLHQERYNSNGNGAVKSEKMLARNTNLPIEEPDVVKQKMLRVKNAMELNINNSAVDLSSKKSHNLHQVINVEEYSSTVKKLAKHQSADELVRDLTKPKMNLSSNVLPRPQNKEKKEKKHRERKEKQDKAMKEFSKIMKKQQQVQDQLKEIETHKMAQNLPPFSFFPRLANSGFSGLMPGPSLIPTGPLFSHLNNNAILGGMMPPDPASMLPNPFSLAGTAPNPFALIPPGLGNNPLLPNLSHSFGKIPQMPAQTTLTSFLRRPSLEVIPIDEDNNQPHPKHSQKPQYITPPLTVKEKEKPEKSKISANNSMIFNNINILRTSPLKQSSPKLNPLLKMPPVKPDVTIKLNPPEIPKPINIPKVEPMPVEIPPPILPPKDKDKQERKKDKLHKKEKREKEKDKELKVKKKKDKKDRLKIKIEKKRDKEIKQELKEKQKKERKEKRKGKEKNSAAAAVPVPPEGLVPKLTLKLGPASPMLPPSPDNPRKLNIKPVVRKEEPPPPPVEPPSLICEERLSAERSQSPELARISALVTRPPKSKSSSKHSNPVVKSEVSQEVRRSHSPPPQASNTSPVRKNRPPSTFSKYKRIYFKPIPKRNNLDDSIMDLDGDEPNPSKESPLPDKVPNIPLGTPFYMDPQGNKIWICPACGRPDNGSPMIGCDGGCDGWYHWVCVGIRVAPDDTEDWYCVSCIAKRTAMASAMASTMTAGQTGKKRGRKPKAEKLREVH